MKTATRITWWLLAGALLAAVCVSLAPAADLSPYDPKKIVTPPIGKIPSVHPERFTLPNGIVVFLLENHDLPVVRGTAYFPMSPTQIPADRAGLGSLTGEVMRSGGSAAHSGDWLDDRLAAIGASVNSNISGTLANSGFRCLSEDLGEVIGLWSEITRVPAFPDDKIELSKVGLRQQIASRNDEMFPILFRVSGQAVYGDDSPWARRPEYATVEPIAAGDCRKLHDAVFVPERMIVAVYGDFRTAEMKKLLAGKLGDWKRSGSPVPALPPTPTAVEPKLFYAPKEDVTQSGIVVAQPGSRADDPDYASLQVLEQALGGGFSSRMFNRIRTQRGLAYATGANAGVDYQRPGVFVAFSLTRSDSTMVALDLVREEVRKITQAPLSESELQVAKQAVVNGFVFNFEDPSQVLFRAAYYEAVGYPADFLTTYQKALDAVTAQSVLEAAKRKTTPDKQVAIIVGKEKDFERPLASAGLPVDRIDISIPPPPSKLGAVPSGPEAKQKGAAWLAAAAQAAGGTAAWSAVHSVITTQDATISVQGQSISLTGEESWRLPDHRLSVQKLPFGEVKQGCDGQSGWTSAMGQLKDDPKAGAELAKDYERSLWRLFSDPLKVELVALDAPETIAGASYNAAAVTGAQQQDLEVLFTPEGKFAGFAYQSEGSGPQMPPARVAELYDGWSAEGQLIFPHTLKILRDGKPFLEGKVTALKLNPPLGDELFKKPAQ
jgi:zinc protease